MTPHRNDWRVTMCLFAATGLVESLAFGHLGAFTPLFLEELRVRPDAVPFWTGALSAMAFVIGLPLLPFWGVWADRYGQKPIIIRSSVVAAVMFGLTAASQNIWHLAGARLVSGFVFGNTGIMMALQARITPPERLGTAVAIVSAGSPVGIAAGPYLGGLVVERWGIRALLATDAALTLLVALALVLFLKEEHRNSDRSVRLAAGVKDALAAVARTPSVPVLFGAIFLMAAGRSAAEPFVPILIQNRFGGEEPARTIGAVLTVSGAAMAIATPFWGGIGDRFGHLRVLRYAALITAVAYGGQALAAQLGWLIVWRLVLGVSIGALGALATTLLALYTPEEKRASVLNLSLLPQQLAWFSGPLLGAAVSLFGVSAPFWAALLLLAAGTAMTRSLPAPARPLVS